MQMDQRGFIQIRGARVHNLKNINIDIPLNKLVCLAGPSGSGKTSLAFHTLLTESKRRFVNSFPNSLKFFSDRPSAVDVDSISPVLPVFGLPQINPIVGSRSVVSDIMKLTDSFQNLFHGFSHELCPVHKEELVLSSPATQLTADGTSKGVGHILVHRQDYSVIMGEDFIPARSYSAEEQNIHSYDESDEFWEIFRFKWDQPKSIDKKFAELKILEAGISLYLFSDNKLERIHFKNHKHCPICFFESKQLASVNAFSPYSALGACTHCNGYGANLVYDDRKLISHDLTINEGGLKFLNYSPFHDEKLAFMQLAKKEKIPLDVPIKTLPKSFFKLLEEGSGKFCGYGELKRYLESKRYKPAVRIYISQLKKEEPCSVCETTRLNENIFHYFLKFNDQFFSLKDLMKLTVNECFEIFKDQCVDNSTSYQRLCREVVEKLQTAKDLGLGHLSLLRKVKSISAGEYQRLLLIKYLSFKGTDSLFILDEPSLGLREGEIRKLILGLRNILDQGNSVILIDHSELVQSLSDELIVMGPASGKEGGEILYHGNPKEFLKKKERIVFNVKKHDNKNLKFIEVKEAGIYGNTFKDIKIPLNRMTWIDGPSGTGKTSLFIKVIGNEISKKIGIPEIDDAEYRIKGLKNYQGIRDVIVVSSDLNRFTSRSTIGSMTELASVIRKHFLKLPMVKSMNLKEGHLSSNSELGMCPKCEGKGSITIEMQYLEDIVLECEECRGLKIKPLYANLSDGKMTLSEAYSKPISEVLSRVTLTPKFRRVWDYLKLLNLDYLSLDRPLNSLSGGERQRIYLLNRLLKNITDTLIIFENISFGLSDRELAHLGTFLNDLSDFDNTILIIDASPSCGKITDFKLDGEQGFTLTET
ncbi:MAG TPA: hypothetical protein VKZ84_04530 [Bacteriovoracaceae bacterium]|nr:hypothetical protein [Bacteriovoracaceae bacterium]